MIVIQILGTPSYSTKERLQAITADLLRLCRERVADDGYITFPADRMQMDLGTEIVALVSGVEYAMGFLLAAEVSGILWYHFHLPGETTKIGVQVIEARTVRELTKKEESTCRS